MHRLLSCRDMKYYCVVQPSSMLTKEYRICLPMSVDEYRIAQLYMIQVSVLAHCCNVRLCLNIRML